MKLSIQGKEAYVSIFHMSSEEFAEKHPELVQDSPLSRGIVPKKVTLAEVTYNGLRSSGIAYCHENDTFNRRRGSADALERALKQHPDTKSNKELRTQIFQKMFRSSPSPYALLDSVVRGRPELAKKLADMASTTY